MKSLLDIRILFICFLSQLIIVSCMERDEQFLPESDYITFTASLEQNSSPEVKSFSSNFSSNVQEWDLDLDTKVAISTKLSGKANIIGLLSGSNDFSNSYPWEPFSDNEFYFNGDELTSKTAVRWGQIPSETPNLKLFVYTPNEIEGAALPSLNEAGNPVISYILPPDKSKHVDLITAVKEVGADYRKSIPLVFNHAFTALKFKMGFDCVVYSLTIKGIYNKGEYVIGEGWNQDKYGYELESGKTYTEYKIDFGASGKSVKTDEDLYSDVMMMIPQTVPSNASIEVEYQSGNTVSKISASLSNLKWEESKLITYTLYRKEEIKYIYFDLSAGNVNIKADGGVIKYSGKVYINNGTEAVDVTGTHAITNKYYIYQSSDANRASTGWSGDVNSTITLPSYRPAFVNVNNKEVLWSDYITNNRSVSKVIMAWDNKAGATGNFANSSGAAKNVGRQRTNNYIYVSGAVDVCDIYIDNIYSTYNDYASRTNSRTVGTISFVSPSQASGSHKLRINMIGDNRVNNVHYSNTNSKNSNQIVFQGVGSLTVADADYNITTDGNRGESQCDTSFYSNHWNSAIGNSDSGNHSYGIVINSGVLFAGTTKAENCTAIGGGGNGAGSVTINGGVVTAVATTTGTAIGGGIGFHSEGGAGTVTINGGNIYAYNHANTWQIPSSAIGGAGSSSEKGNTGTVTINGGNIYAQSAYGTAIGGGSSRYKNGGAAIVTINDGIVVAKSLSSLSAGIGGGTTRTIGGAVDNNVTANGGNATIYIGKTGSVPIIRTGSIGGGGTNATGGKIGNATIEIYNGDIQAQFVMAASDDNNFTMSGGLIRNSYHTDADYKHIQMNGGAVYMEQGTFTMSGGEIKNCTGLNGGAVYIKGTEATTFTMTGGTISQSTAVNSGGALYLEGGNVKISKGSIYKNLAEQGNGGAVCIVGGNFEMPAGGSAQITQNAAYSKNTQNCGSGGGVYVTSSTADVKVDILSGEISNNTSDRFGGGLCVDMGNSTDIAATVTVGKTGASTNSNPLIKSNTASLQGGGLYVRGEKANITINDGKIRSNNTAGYVANPDVANEGGMVTLNGGDVTHVVVTYMPNGGEITLDGQPVSSVSQKIVTATNSKMVVPGEFKRAGWKVSYWHTRPDGDDTKGKRYEIGSTLNVSADLPLFAQWEKTIGI